jgi:hypothetical protein
MLNSAYEHGMDSVKERISGLATLSLRDRVGAQVTWRDWRRRARVHGKVRWSEELGTAICRLQ